MKTLRSRAFTLIELLVVVAIIAILAAILFPVFAQAKSSALKTASLANLKQISLAWLLYNGDYDDTVMRTRIEGPDRTYYWWGSWDGSTLRTDEGLLYRYTKSEALSGDPTFPGTMRTALGLTGYGYNYAYLSPSDYLPDWTEVPRPVGYGQIGAPADTVVFATAARINNWAFDPPVLEGNAYLDPPSSAFPSFHGRTSGGKGPTAWADGHARAVAPKMRSGSFGYGFDGAWFLPHRLGELDRDGDFTTDELFDLD